jgi:hypothetical protein
LGFTAEIMCFISDWKLFKTVITTKKAATPKETPIIETTEVKLKILEFFLQIKLKAKLESKFTVIRLFVQRKNAGLLF